MNQVMTDAKNLALILANKPTTTILDNEAWDRIYEIAGKQWLIGALAVAINKMPDELKPKEPQLIACVNEVLKFQVEREEQIKQEIVNLNKLLEPFGPVLWLKGADDLIQEVFDDSGQAWMVDIDCLLPEINVKEAWNKLISLGYLANQPSKANNFNWVSSEWHNAPEIYNPKTGITVELHRYVGRLYTRNIFNEKLLRTNKKYTIVDSNIGTFYCLEPNLGLIHRILHAQIFDKTEKRQVLNMRYLFHIYKYLKKHETNIDWPLIEKCMRNHGYNLTLKRFMFLLDWLFAYKTPLYDESKNVGLEYLKKTAKNHSYTKSNKIKKKAIFVFKTIFNSLSPREVKNSSLNEPSNIFDWMHIYLRRIIRLSKRSFSRSSWKRRINRQKFYDRDDW